MIPAVTKYRVAQVNSASLLHFDGANNGTVFTDVYSNTWTRGGSGAVTSTTQFKFGTAAFTGAGTGYILGPSAPFVLGTSDFTIEVQVYATANDTYYGIYAKRTDSTHSGSAVLNIDATVGKLHGAVSNSGVGGSWTIDLFTSAALTLNAWHHVALVRFGTTFTLYLDGVSQQSNTLSGALFDNGASPVIGAIAQDGTLPFAGYLDEFRFSLVARYTANFTPPSAPFTF